MQLFKAGTVKIDLMIEMPQAIVDQRGTIAVGGLVRAGRGRVVSAAFGVYDYTASCNIEELHGRSFVAIAANRTENVKRKT